ncbi:hypothetical protein JW935_05670, partial [candidate division KSB1 bacterium]|nr:hypothetical protein [candidate division KSB1 bacterium]
MKQEHFYPFVMILLTGFGLNTEAGENPDTNKATATGPGYYKILSKSDKPIKIPFKMHRGKPLMELEINGQKATLMIDNGILWDQV